MLIYRAYVHVNHAFIGAYIKKRSYFPFTQPPLSPIMRRVHVHKLA
ncbi:Uncharacterized protein YR821_0098 [Yersinia ruckeri]|nr:hypothetical protein yruck0001_34270 [Yersinia ruckeri ATCC 29473]QTD75031.1 Uncharacterized protein YR821_0098 [Yersinia ruckeri]